MRDSFSLAPNSNCKARQGTIVNPRGVAWRQHQIAHLLLFAACQFARARQHNVTNHTTCHSAETAQPPQLGV